MFSFTQTILFLISAKHYQIHMHWFNHSSASPYGFKAKLFLTLHGATNSTPEHALNEYVL